MSNALGAIPSESRAVIVDELTRRNPELLAGLRRTQEPTTDQREAVERVLAVAVIKSLGPDWVPNEHGLAVERAIEAFLRPGRYIGKLTRVERAGRQPLLGSIDSICNLTNEGAVNAIHVELLSTIQHTGGARIVCVSNGERGRSHSSGRNMATTSPTLPASGGGTAGVVEVVEH